MIKLEEKEEVTKLYSRRRWSIRKGDVAMKKVIIELEDGKKVEVPLPQEDIAMKKVKKIGVERNDGKIIEIPTEEGIFISKEAIIHRKMSRAEFTEKCKYLAGADGRVMEHCQLNEDGTVDDDTCYWVCQGGSCHIDFMNDVYRSRAL